MSPRYAILMLLALSLMGFSGLNNQPNIYEFKLKDILGNDVPLSRYQGKVLLIVNVASQCKHTKQYADLQALYEQYSAEGLVVMGVPSNDFFNGEPGTEEEISAFCTQKYAVTFPMFGKTSVKGKKAHPLYRFLTDKELNGISSDKVSWNFHKFLVDREGRLVKSFPAKTRVNSKSFEQEIKKLL